MWLLTFIGGIGGFLFGCALPSSTLKCKRIFGDSIIFLRKLPLLEQHGRSEMHACRYDTGVISGALPYMQDDVLRIYLPDAAR